MCVRNGGTCTQVGCWGAKRSEGSSTPLLACGRHLQVCVVETHYSADLFIYLFPCILSPDISCYVFIVKSILASKQTGLGVRSNQREGQVFPVTELNAKTLTKCREKRRFFKVDLDKGTSFSELAACIVALIKVRRRDHLSEAARAAVTLCEVQTSKLKYTLKLLLYYVLYDFKRWEQLPCLYFWLHPRNQTPVFE